jgi:ADP-ribose pyrophosphatase YjhB (NUDIX family)
VLFGFDGDNLNVLLVRQKNQSGTDMTSSYKLPGSLIYMDEDLDDAAQRVLNELTGLTQVKMLQFRAFGAVSRLSNPQDTVWLKRFHKLSGRLERIVTIAYLSLLRISPRYLKLEHSYEANWVSVANLPTLAFDHKEIIETALQSIRDLSKLSPSRLFELLPRKFTIAQLHHLYEVVFAKKFDIRNFHKKIQTMPYLVALDEKEVGVNHRAARYYKFDKSKL